MRDLGQPQKLSEADVTSQIRGFMESRGWRALRFQRTVMPGQFSTHEPGTPDLQMIKYVPSAGIGCALVLWLEMKKRGARAVCRCRTKKPRQRCSSCDQANWRERERRRGAQVWVVDDLGWFISEYERVFGWLHTGDGAWGQLDLLAGVK